MMMLGSYCCTSLVVLTTLVLLTQASQVAPRNFQLTAESPTCIKLKWDNVLYPNGQVSGITYQYKCLTGSWRDIPANEQVCGFTPNTLIECQIRAARQTNNNNKYSEVAVNSVTTPCESPPPTKNLAFVRRRRGVWDSKWAGSPVLCNTAGPLPPKNFAFGNPTLVVTSGRKMWRYSVTWQKDNTHNCIHLTNPYLLLIDNTTVIDCHHRSCSQTSYSLYRDGGVPVTVTMWQRDQDEAISRSSVTQSITTSTVNIPPQSAPQNFQLIAASPYCVLLSWNPVQYPNGPVDDIIYQYKCQTDIWTDIPTDKQVCSFTPNTLIQCQIRAARRTNNNNKYSEVAVKSVTTPYVPEAPTNLKLISTNSTCVGLSWDYTGPGGRITNFQYRCDSVSWKTSSSDKRSTVECGFKPYQQVSCDIRTVNDKVYSNISTSLTVRTNCSAPSEPQWLTFGSRAEVSDSGIKKWKYVVSWQAPASTNCAGLHQMKPYDVRYPTSSSNTATEPSTSTTVYSYGEEEISFTVWVRNNDMLLSQPASRTIRTPKIYYVPEAPTNLKLISTVSSCVRLSWDYTGLGSRITNFQYRCDSVSWKTSSSDKRSTVECGFKPYQQVSCDIRTVNDKVYSNISTSLSVRTNCSEPSVPINLKFGLPYYTSRSGNKKWRYLLSWQAPTDVNCESLDLTNPYMIRFPSESSTTLNVNSTSAVVYADWNELVVFSVWARNRDGLMSQPAFTSITTPAKDMKSRQEPECPKTISGVADPSIGKGQIELNLADQQQILHLPIGQHLYTTTIDEGSNCSVLLVVYDSQVQRRLDFEARYDIPCSILNDSLTSKLILSIARQNYDHVKVLCDGLCTVTDNSSPNLSCQNNTLAITWPTETVYRADVTTIPQDVAAKIKKRLIQNKAFFPIIIISRMPPIVYPLANKDGTPVRIGLKSQCVTVDGSVYNEVKDVCEKRSL